MTCSKQTTCSLDLSCVKHESRSADSIKLGQMHTCINKGHEAVFAGVLQALVVDPGLRPSRLMCEVSAAHKLAVNAWTGSKVSQHPGLACLLWLADKSAAAIQTCLHRLLQNV